MIAQGKTLGLQTPANVYPVRPVGVPDDSPGRNPGAADAGECVPPPRPVGAPDDSPEKRPGQGETLSIPDNYPPAGK